jgi:hypothetical protein
MKLLSQDLIHKSAALMAQELVNRLNLEREEQERQAYEEFYVICRAGVEAFSIKHTKIITKPGEN